MMVCRNSEERAHSVCHLLKACLDSPGPMGLHHTWREPAEAGPLPSCKRGLLVTVLHHQKPFLQFKTEMHSMSHPLSWPMDHPLIRPLFVWMRKQRLTLEPGAFPVWAA